MANVKNLRTGFTGELDEASGVAAKAKQAASYVKDEASAVAFLAGYLFGSAASPPPQRRRYW